MTEQTRILLIGGTEEARQLNAILADIENVNLVTSLAGRTTNPAKLRGRVVTGGFGGAAGLAAFLDQNNIQKVIDASHPYAANITHTAATVCREKEISYVRFNRLPWKMEAGDQWIPVSSIEQAAVALTDYMRIFLSVGRQELEYFANLSDRFFLVRSIEKVAFEPVGSETIFIRERGPFQISDEIRLMRQHHVNVVVSKNSGGATTYGKIAAARSLQLPVIMIDRPILPRMTTMTSIEDILSSIAP
ncbi:cobalt-precorrin-6A reductase [Sneathiella marina]|uniref:Cobalt-precorrin-6A reductase n=1 Tax=Sneathiella marina TaxID=2950108 RepID=A0ABY4W612_9PROT|nr:cobalt-precorrin-6A reductase [Sneathiella marina]USG62296.1 cobalt-precorrin-6A reductase [Sneathiella marina]